MLECVDISKSYNIYSLLLPNPNLLYLVFVGNINVSTGATVISTPIFVTNHWNMVNLPEK